MSIYADFSDDDSSKAVIMPEDNFLNQQKSNEERQIENHFSIGQESNVNKLLNNESFEKAFNQAFQPRINENIIWHEEDIEPPYMEIKPVMEEKEIIKSLEEKKVIVKVKEKNDKYFPFTKGQGIPKTLEKIWLSNNFSSPKFSLSTFHNNIIISNTKFKTTGYYIDEKGKKRK